MATAAKIPIVIDTREQIPWEFDADSFSTISQKLVTGDVSVLGLEDYLTIERKTLGDAVSSVIHDWMRFRKVLYRMAGMDLAIVVIEAALEDVYAKKYESDATPESVVGKLISITTDHGVPVVFAGCREAAITFSEHFLSLAVKKLGGVP